MDGGLETKVAFGDMMQAFEAFKDANDERLAQIEARMSADVVTTEKVDRINRAVDEAKARLDELTLKARRPQLSGETAERPLAREHKQAFDSYVRKGEAHGLTTLEAKALSASSNPDGGFLVPPEIETEIGRRVAIFSPIRAISSVRQVSSPNYRKPFNTAGFATGWVGETAARPETATPALAELQFPTMELYAMPSATQSLLDDVAVNIEQWIAEEVQQAFAEQEGVAFVTGNGVNRPKGFLDYPRVADTSWSWGNIGFVLSGAAAGFPTANPSDRLFDLAYALRAAYRQNASWVMNRRTQNTIRKFRDSTGNYLWEPAIRPDGRATLMGFPITESEAMPDIAADSAAVAFGDFGQGYLVVDRLGVRVLRDPYSAKPYVLFYTTKRVGGGVQNFEAIKLMRFAAT
jgi:HK97 family phage major capsid protein